METDINMYDAARLEAKIDELEAENAKLRSVVDELRSMETIERLRAAVEKMGIGVNHIATYRTDRWPDYGTACDVALEKLGGSLEYDMWCCWNAAMCARDELAGPHEQ